MGAACAEQDAQLVGQRAQLLAPQAHLGRRFSEALTATGPDLCLGGDQLADEVRFDLAPRGEGLQLLEAIVERERVGIEQRELLFDRHGEVASTLELFACRRQLLVDRKLLLLAHCFKEYRVPADTSNSKGLEQPLGHRLPAPVRHCGAARGPPEYFALRRR